MHRPVTTSSRTTDDSEPGVEDAIRKSAAKKPKWVDPQLTPAEALEIQTFSRRGNTVLLQFTVGDEGTSSSGWAEGTGDHLIEFLSKTFAMAGVETIDSFVYSEHEIQDLEDDEELTLADEESDSSPLEDEHVVVTGKFPGHSREDMEDFVEELGGTVQKSIGKKTTLLVVGANAGKSKLTKAEELGIRCLNDEDFLQLLDQ